MPLVLVLSLAPGVRAVVVSAASSGTPRLFTCARGRRGGGEGRR